MANPHFGEIGDVWKHLVVGDVLDRVRPARYWETHAGSGTYALDRSWEREYGVFTLLREAPRAPAINASRFLGLVRTLPPRDDGVPRYPASARLAMEVLGDGATYLLCDLDPGSVADLTRKGWDLWPVLMALSQWGEAYALGPEGPVLDIRHTDCDAPVRVIPAPAC